MAKVKTKYNGIIEWGMYQEHLVNQVFKILPLMEENKDWRRYLEGLLIEINGLHDLLTDVNFISILGKLNGLIQITEAQAKDGHLKKTVFDTIELVKSINPDGE